MAERDAINVVNLRVGTTMSKGPPVDPPSGGGDDGHMERRLSEVEKAIIGINGHLTRIESGLGDVKGQVGSFKWQVFGASVAMLLAVIAFGVAIQQMTVSTFQAAAQVEQKSQQPTIIVVPGALSGSASAQSAASGVLTPAPGK